jgi:hypothetical protein
MKKIIFFIFCYCATIGIAQAQTSKGSWMLGGNASFSQEKYQSEKYTKFSVSPQMGYFLHNNWVVGLTPTLFSDKNNAFENKGAGLGVFSRYYIGKEKIKFFPECSFLWIKSKFKNNGFSGESNNEYYNIGLGAGVAYFLNKNVSIEGAFRLNKAERNQNGLDSDTIGFYIGLQVFLPKE